MQNKNIRVNCDKIVVYKLLLTNNLKICHTLAMSVVQTLGET